MFCKKWSVGLDIQPTQLIIVAIKQQKQEKQLAGIWQVPLSKPLFDEKFNIQKKSFISALQCIHHLLPRHISLRTVLPALTIFQHNQILPKTKLHQNELFWLSQQIISQHLSIPVNELLIDYDIDTSISPQRLIISATYRHELNEWLTLFSQADLTLDVIEQEENIINQLAYLSGLSNDHINDIKDWQQLAIHNHQFPFAPIQPYLFAAGLAIRPEQHE